MKQEIMSMMFYRNLLGLNIIIITHLASKFFDFLCLNNRKKILKIGFMYLKNNDSFSMLDKKKSCFKDFYLGGSLLFFNIKFLINL